MQFVITDAQYGITSGRISTNIYFIVAVFNGIHLDLIDSYVNVSRTTQMDIMGLITQLYNAFGYHCVYYYTLILGWTSECGMFCNCFLDSFMSFVKN